MIGKTKLDQLAKKLRELRSKETKIWLNAANVSDVKRLVKLLNTEIQLGKLNIDATGTQLSDIGGYYSPVTLMLAAESGHPKKGSDKIDLKDTGAFYSSFLVTINVKGITIEADTIKDGQDLRDRWGENIIGLTNENIKIVQIKILENYKKQIRYYLGL